MTLPVKMVARVAAEHRLDKPNASRMLLGVDQGSDFELSSILRSVSQA